MTSKEKNNIDIMNGAACHDQTLHSHQDDSFRYIHLSHQHRINVNVQGLWYFTGMGVSVTGMKIWEM